MAAALRWDVPSFADVPQQHRGTIECGLFVLAFAALTVLARPRHRLRVNQNALPRRSSAKLSMAERVAVQRAAQGTAVCLCRRIDQGDHLTKLNVLSCRLRRGTPPLSDRFPVAAFALMKTVVLKHPKGRSNPAVVMEHDQMDGAALVDDLVEPLLGLSWTVPKAA